MKFNLTALITFVVVSTITVIVGLAVYNRVARQFPQVGRVVQGNGQKAA